MLILKILENLSFYTEFVLSEKYERGKNVYIIHNLHQFYRQFR